ncbi:glycosyltransferase family 4 protein, partial [Methylobacterium trifolii]
MASSGSPVNKVLIIVENLPVPFDRRVWSEATALRRAGYEVSVICPKGRDAETAYEVIDGVHIYRHPLPHEGHGALGYLVEYSAALFWEFVLSLKVLRERGFDVIHACNPPDLIFLVGGFYKYLFGKKFVFDHHDINPELYEAKFGRRDWGWRLMLLVEKLTFKVADISLATNGSYRQIAIERGGMAPERVHIVRSGPNLSRIKEPPADPAWRRGRRFLVGYVGVIGQQEGLDLLLDAVSHVVSRRGRTDVQFVVVGGGPALAEIEAACAAAGLSEYVTFTGRVPDETLFSALSSADVCVNPDRPNAMNDKSTMNKIMEYMALGKPIVQFDLTEGRFSAEGASLYAQNTVPADFGDKILELLDDPERRARMGAVGRARVRDTLAWQYEEPKLLAAYARLLQPEAGAAPVRLDEAG